MPRALPPLALLALALFPRPVAAQDADEGMVKAMAALAAADKYPLPFDAVRAKAVRADRVKWHRAGSVGVFDKGPGAKAAWAPKARAVLELYARRMAQMDLSGAAAAGLDALSDRLAREAVAAGCDDPLVRYLAEYKLARGPRADAKAVAAFRDTVTALDASGYGDGCKLYAANNWMAAAGNRPLGDPLQKGFAKWNERFWELFEKVAGDPDPAAAAIIYALAESREGSDLAGPKPLRTRRQNFDEIAGHLDAAKAPKAVRLTYEGQSLSRQGWDARGGGVAATVTAEGFKVYRERLAEAKERFEAAWAADKTRHQAATGLVKLCKDLSLPREEMELWFGRAIGLNPDDRWACLYKMERLSPRWGGKAEDMAAFSWMCATSPNAEGLIPVTVIDYQLSKTPVAGPVYEANRAAFEGFYAKPAVWVSLHAALEGVLKAYPDDVYLRSMHARLACVAGRHAVAVAAFDKLGGKFDPQFFPGKGEYERLAAAAKAALGKGP